MCAGYHGKAEKTRKSPERIRKCLLWFIMAWPKQWWHLNSVYKVYLSPWLKWKVIIINILWFLKRLYFLILNIGTLIIVFPEIILFFFFFPVGLALFAKQLPAEAAGNTYCWCCNLMLKLPVMQQVHVGEFLSSGRTWELLPCFQLYMSDFIIFIALTPLGRINFTLFYPSKLMKYISPDGDWKLFSPNLKPYFRLWGIPSLQSVFFKADGFQLKSFKWGYYLD